MARYIEAAQCADIISEQLNIPLLNLVDVFADIPTADVQEVRHGRWIDPECEFNLPKCSICGSRSHDATYADRDKFCSHCGSRMDWKK